jgi:isoprenylcysteine carboxyl methyltransferase (ICMT) family protein YpbQ
MHRSRPITAALTGGSVVVAAVSSPMVLAIVAVIVLLVYCGVILPAIWSTKPTRRRDARHVLQQLLRLIREPRAP